jgi:hypothetical protein
MAAAASLSTHQKALAVNLAPRTYGAFAEIDGGQEVARWFFSVGSAATGVTKSISAYDRESIGEPSSMGTGSLS